MSWNALVAAFSAALFGCAATPSLPTSVAPNTAAPVPLSIHFDEEQTTRLLGLMRERLSLMPLVARAKWNTERPIEDSKGEAQILDTVTAEAVKRGLPPEWVRSFFRAQMEAGKRIQRDCFERWRSSGAGHLAGAPDLVADLRPRIAAITAAILDSLEVVAPMLESSSFQSFVQMQGDVMLKATDVGSEARRTALAPLLAGTKPTSAQGQAGGAH